MGITGLLPFLDNATKKCHISEFRGGSVAVDTYCWLHKGANACVEQLVRGEDCDAYVQFCLKYVKMLLNFDVHPIMVFDGKNLPAKAETEAKRRENRKKAKQRATELLRLGKADEARLYLKQSIDITPQMALNLIKECRKINVDCIVAPYESDAQLAYFSLKSVVDVIITEDSDLVLFGCKKVMYKMDLTGTGYLVEADNIYKSMKLRPDQYTFEKFLYMCILSGCDYLPSLPGIGLKKALKFISLTAETNPKLFLDKLPRYLNKRHLVITEDYKANFLMAEATFRHQTVFDPFKKKLVSLTDPEIFGTDLVHCKNAGEKYDEEKALQVAFGNLHPKTFEVLDNWSPPVMINNSRSIWSGRYKKSIPRKEQICETKKEFKISLVKKKEEKETCKGENIKCEEDQQIESELQFYSVKSTECSNSLTGSSIKEECVEKTNPPTSPILGRKTVNPFLKHRKLSKFKMTPAVDSNVIVKSRFFTPPTLQTNTNESPPSDIEESPTTCINDEVSNVENVSNNENIVITHNGIENTSNDEVSHLSNIENVPDNENILITQNAIENTSEEIFSSQLNNKGQNQNKYSKQSTTLEVTKPKKIQTCRTVGLKRRAGQKTLQDFFKKMKQNE